MRRNTHCPFCDYVGPSEVLDFAVVRGVETFFIEPLDPVTRGHLLAIPREHVEHFAEDPVVTGAVFEAAAQYATAHAMTATNLITSKGVAATQSVRHLHVHLVPRRLDDGLALPWS